ncbi:alkaline phosphatase D family protein [Anditalea andensis]|uniref:Alkaline phosphatase n=1 Tax=Anditalea andensis TaxID=1048983 RepID=A0A074KS34_9BACT|nr:alkaline phosphatase D family protein [Anditalea andensis]KEO71699.1 alkaline phosphatase [Anditalea andensis]
MNIKFQLPFLIILCCACVWTSEAQTKMNQMQQIELIAFGSCNKHDLPQPLWKPILKEKSDVWIWLGDNVYGDTHDMALLRSKYLAQKEHEDYKKLRTSSKIIGVWDDHDYGINDGGIHYTQKDSSQQLMLDFLDEAKDSPRRKQKGVYASYTYGVGDNKVKVILLDTRYHRDTILMENKNYVPNLEGSLLGEEQWAWLQKELKKNDASVTLIAGGIQFIPTEHPYEKWDNFPNERKRLLDLISTSKVKNPVLISGDRHIAEISLLKNEQFPNGLYEITSSGLTHTWREYREEYNPYRVGKMIASLHYGTVAFDWSENRMVFQIKGEQGQTFLEQQISIR